MIQTTHRIDHSKLYSEEFYDIREYLTQLSIDEVDIQCLRTVKTILNDIKIKPKEERVIDIINFSFEQHFGMTLDEFQSIKNHIIQAYPERLL